MAIILNGSNTPTAGGVGYGDGSNLAFTGAGTSGQVLTSAGTGTPTWTTPSSGAMILISTKTASSSASLEWTGLNGYDKYIIVCSNLVPSGSGAGFYSQVGTGTGPTYVTSGYGRANLTTTNNGAAPYVSIDNSYPASFFYFIGCGQGIIGGNTPNVGASCTATFTGMLGNSSNPYCSINGYGTYQAFLNGTYTFGNMIESFSGSCSSSTAKTAIKIYPSSGTITSGTASLYGISS